MKATPILIISVVLANTGVALAQDNTLSQFAHLKEPKVSTRKSEKMLVVEAKGDPKLVGPKAIALLFQLYFSIRETPKGPTLSPLRARWPVPINAPRSEWVGLYALPVPDTVTAVPEHQAPEGLKASVTVWDYGDVGEILHVGPYEKEEPTMRKLKDALQQQGYHVLEGHEEEYIKGPTMSGPGDPEQYITIIRYRLQKATKR